MTKRQEQVNSLLQREISSHLFNQRLEGITGILTVTRADVSADMKQANIYFSVIGQTAEEVLETLNKSIYELQGALNRRLEMRPIPRIRFVIDESGEYAQRIGKIIQEL